MTKTCVLLAVSAIWNNKNSSRDTNMFIQKFPNPWRRIALPLSTSRFDNMESYKLSDAATILAALHEVKLPFSVSIFCQVSGPENSDVSLGNGPQNITLQLFLFKWNHVFREMAVKLFLFLLYPRHVYANTITVDLETT